MWKLNIRCITQALAPSAFWRTHKNFFNKTEEQHQKTTMSIAGAKLLFGMWFSFQEKKYPPKHQEPETTKWNVIQLAKDHKMKRIEERRQRKFFQKCHLKCFFCSFLLRIWCLFTPVIMCAVGKLKFHSSRDIIKVLVSWKRNGMGL